MKGRIYLRLRHRIQVNPEEEITVGQLSQISGDEVIKAKVSALPVYKVKAEDKNIVVLDLMYILKRIQIKYPDYDIQPIGDSETIVEIVYQKKQLTLIMFGLVWLLLFIGSGLAIMNFHEDVSMKALHQNLYKLVTGEENKYPYILQVPYSLGLGLGMVLFFNHIFKKRFNEEPSPLEVEMFKYQLDLDQYVSMTENKESIKKLNDH
ncbi:MULTISPECIES: stage V sporulation protein AA [Bacillus]|uniref:Stage V sporulation protein AA n=2 Tax=Bacillus TaxID=1386 RepID=A0A0M5JGG2_9BACI|nr:MULTISPECIES: stage V sporulation protein AA [Bacillus]ALC81477.1 stage V sporulation protein AA [Bacillus gobiensis]MBP1080519.1 stage V sporulation protein AA [Bacillus capparidis]MED1094376.1 stage V sporulation protein AA [Bacillus capparidis]